MMNSQIVYVHLLPEFHHWRRSILQRDLTAVAHIKFLKFHTVFYKNNNKVVILTCTYISSGPNSSLCICKATYYITLYVVKRISRYSKILQLLLL